MEEMINYSELKRIMGTTYIGSVAGSAKIEKSYKAGTNTYCVYLAPADLSGHNVCPRCANCRSHCLNESGRAKIDSFTGGDKIMHARLQRTNFFYEDRVNFMRLMINELRLAKARADREHRAFSVRLNGTSDLNPKLFKDETGRCVLDIFPDVQFYDYTKVSSRMKLMQEYPNYYLTFSYDGANWIECEKWLRKGYNVAVVFYGNELPKTFNGWNVIDGNQFDMRYLDAPQSIVGLHYHVTARDYELINGKRVFTMRDTPFVVRQDDLRCEW